jgi:hypothetical protein
MGAMKDEVNLNVSHISFEDMRLVVFVRTGNARRFILELQQEGKQLTSRLQRSL